MDQDESSSNSSLFSGSRGNSSGRQQPSTLNCTAVSSDNGGPRSRCSACGGYNGSNDLGAHALISSHDTSTSHYHTDLESLLGDLTGALHAAWPKRHITYSEVHVLMITWQENNNASMHKEISRLRNIFEDGFAYTIHDLEIPLSKSDLTMRSKIDHFILNYGHEDNLLIVYYAGHARPGVYSGEPPIWYSMDSTGNESTFDTAHIQPILARAENDSPDVLLIYDCCHSAHARRTNNKPTRALVECLFAGGSEARVPTAGPDSFTAALTQELGIALNSPTPWSVADLHRRTIGRLERWMPTPIFDEGHKYIRNKTGKPALTKAVRITPIHMTLSVNEEPRTIFLTPHKEVSREAEIQEHQIKDADKSKGSDLPRVLLAVRIIGNKDTVEELKRWIPTAPRGVVKFEKIYQSYSDLLIVEVPLPVWDLLPRDPAILFIGFTTGEKSLDALTTLNDSTEMSTEAYSQRSPPSFEEDGINQDTGNEKMAHPEFYSRHSSSPYCTVRLHQAGETTSYSRESKHRRPFKAEKEAQSRTIHDTLAEHTPTTTSRAIAEPKHVIIEDDGIQATEHLPLSYSEENEPRHPSQVSQRRQPKPVPGTVILSTSPKELDTCSEEGATENSGNMSELSPIHKDSPSQRTDNSSENIDNLIPDLPSRSGASRRPDGNEGTAKEISVSQRSSFADHALETDQELLKKQNIHEYQTNNRTRHSLPDLGDVNHLSILPRGPINEQVLEAITANAQSSTLVQNDLPTASMKYKPLLDTLSSLREQAISFDFPSWLRTAETSTLHHQPLPIAEQRFYADPSANEPFVAGSHTMKSRQDRSAHGMPQSLRY
ncbi:hypothetical protein F5Y05DRAFT_190187 [Hypoxylon sp. FL0543]|nr:hypothetical protein F5Y05DRAFT_190187 [Hypoxylon sp. FL0543]